MKPLPTTLYHFTCEHGRIGISKTGILRPRPHPFMQNLGPLLWLTDLAEPPSKESLGLTGYWTVCDRLAYRYSARAKAAVHWFDVRGRAPQDAVAMLESYAQPEHWYVVRRALTAVEFAFDASYAREVPQ